MDRFSTGILAILAVASPACDGGGGSRSSACAGLATAVNACLTEGGGPANPYMEDMCRSLTCTGSKDAFVDSVTQHACNEAMQYDSVVELVKQGCTFPGSCKGVAYWMFNWGGMPIADAIDRCQATTCTGSKDQALQCIVELPPLTSTIPDLDACMAGGGCPPFPLN